MAVILSEMQGRRTPGRGWIEGVLARRPMGVIAVFSDLTESMRAQLRTRDIPFVVVDPTGEPLHDTPSIGATNWNGGLTATRHLLSPGPSADRRHRRARGRPVQPRPPRRLSGRDGRGRRAGRPDASSATATSMSTRASRRAAPSSRLPDRPTAIFTGNDLQALGVYQAAREMRLHIPEDLSVVGFDDLPVARWVGPPLTTVRQPLIEMAEAAAELVLALARGEVPPQTRIELTTELVVRESTAAAPRRIARLTVSRPARRTRRVRSMDGRTRASAGDRLAAEELVDDHRRRPDDAGEAAERRALDREVARRERQRPPVDRLADRREQLVRRVGHAAADDHRATG